MKRYCFITATLFLAFGPLPQIFSQTNSPNLKLVAHLDPLPNRTGDRASFSEVTGSGDLAILGGFEDFFVWIYDLSDRNRPELLATIPIGTPAWDVQVHGRYLFVALSGAMAWYDIIDPRQPRLVNRYSPNPPINPHTFFVAGNTLYVADLVSNGIRLFDITDKKNPKPLADIIDRSWSIHDMTAIRGRLYGAWISGQAGLLVADISNPAAPRELTRVRYPQAGTHHAWPTEDEQFILTTDEVGSTRHNLKIWDARAPGQLTQVAEFTAPGVVDPTTYQSVIHNVYVRGRYAYMSYYCEGVRIVDVADPTKPQQAAFYDLNGNSACSDFNSNWGMHPFSKLIYASDMQEGLYVLEFTDHPAANFTGQVVNAATGAIVPGAMVYFRDEYPSTRTNPDGEFDLPWFKNDTMYVVTEAIGYLPDTSVVITRANAPTATTIRLKGAPHLTIAQTLVDDDQNGGSFGNGNGRLDGVERCELNFALKNSGFAALANGAVRLRSNDPYVTIMDSVQTFGALAIDQSGGLDGALRFSISAATPGDHRLAFHLIATIDNKTTQEIDFHLPVLAPAIRNFRANSTTNSATLRWSAANDPQLAGYHIYRKQTLQEDREFAKLTIAPVTDTAYTAAGLASGQSYTFAITKVVNGVESLFGGRYNIVARNGRPRVLVVNGVDWPTYRLEMTNMYAALPFNANQIFDTWDVISSGQGFSNDYAIIGLAPKLTPADLDRYEVVVWVGNNFNGDIDAWYESLPALKTYLNNGGKLLLITRLLYSFLDDEDFLQNYLHLSRSQVSLSLNLIQQLTPLQRDLGMIPATGGTNSTNSGLSGVAANEFVEPIYYLNNNRNITMGIRARPGATRPYNLVVISGRPYRFELAALKTNLTTIMRDYFSLGTAVDEPVAMPATFALLPNYPNPFSPALAGEINSAGTQIVFQMPRREKVQLEIFNVLGQRVRVLLQAPREAGAHVIPWDGKNETGQNVAAGVYIVRLRAGKFVAERKMTMIR